MPRRLSAFMGGTRWGRPVVFVGPGFVPGLAPLLRWVRSLLEASLVRAPSLFIDRRSKQSSRL
jgi:hypothetical protein